MSSPDPAIPGDPDSEDSAADRLNEFASRAHAGFERAVDENPLLDRVPGRSVTLVGAGLVAAAIALSLLPGFYGVGLVWSTIMLAGAALVALAELRSAGHAAAAEVEVPAGLRHPLLAPAFAALVGLHAFLLLRIGIIPLLWLAAAVLLGWDQYRRAAATPDGFVRGFDLRRAWHGYRRNVTVGVGVCLLSLFFTWGRSSGYWTGGMAYNYAYRYNAAAGEYQYGYDYDYQPMQYYWPGFEFSGRNQSFALFAVAILFGLLLWAAYRGRDGSRTVAPAAGVAGAALLAVFWLLAAKSGIGSLLFLVGLAILAVGAHHVRRGEEAGRWDLEQLTGRLRRRGA
jgi:hypothetical protein